LDRNIFETFGFAFFVGDVIIVVGLRIFGQGHGTLSANIKWQKFDCVF